MVNFNLILNFIHVSSFKMFCFRKYISIFLTCHRIFLEIKTQNMFLVLYKFYAEKFLIYVSAVTTTTAPRPTQQ